MNSLVCLRRGSWDAGPCCAWRRGLLCDKLEDEGDECPADDDVDRVFFFLFKIPGVSRGVSSSEWKHFYDEHLDFDYRDLTNFVMDPGQDLLLALLTRCVL